MTFRLSTCAFLLGAALWSAPAAAQFNAPSAPVPGEDFALELGVVLWTPTPGLRLQTEALAVLGGEVDFVKEFGIDDKRFREFRGVLKAGRRNKLRVSYVPIRYDQDATLQRTFTFGGRTFNVGLPANAKVEWDLWRFGYEFDLIARDRGFFGVLAELKYNKVSASASSPLRSRSYEATAPVPTIGGIARGYLTRNFSITGELTAFKLPDSVRKNFEAKFIDFDVYGTLNLGRHLGVQGGYRSITADYVVDEDFGNLELKGMHFGGLVRF